MLQNYIVKEYIPVSSKYQEGVAVTPSSKMDTNIPQQNCWAMSGKVIISKMQRKEDTQSPG